MKQENILIFPSNDIKSVEFAVNNKKEFYSIAASSNYFNTNKEFFNEWHFLPYVNEPSFLKELQKLLIKYNISKVFTPSAGVWKYLDKYKKSQELNIEIINDYKYLEVASFSNYFFKYASILYNSYLQISSENLLLENEFSSLLYNYHTIFGESGDNKLLSLCYIAPRIPKGDIIEIGVQQGRSAFALTILACRYHIGKVLCIDPWIQTIQNDSPDIIRDMGVGIDNNNFFYHFILNLSLYKEDLNYLKTTSDEAIDVYKSNKTITSREFSTTTYTQKIALLHIDGNHDYTYVRNDLYNYLPYILDNGWIVLDDYVWAFGDGPRKVGDDFLNKNRDNINQCFYSDSALFIQIKESKKIIN